MAVELITGRSGEAHVDSSDVGAYQAYTVGDGVYVLHGAEATLIDANTVRVGGGELLCQGRHVRIKGSGDEVRISNGRSAYKRNDIIAMRYENGEGGMESVGLVVIEGEFSIGDPQDPAMPEIGNVLDGAQVAYWPLYRVRIEGLAPQTPERIAGDNPLSMADSVIQEGTSGGWKYRQWASGKYECWMETGGLKTAYSYGSFKFISANYSFPVTFKATPHISVTPYSGTDLFTATIFEQSTTGVGIRLCALLNVEAWCLGNIYVVGEV